MRASYRAQHALARDRDASGAGATPADQVAADLSVPDPAVPDPAVDRRPVVDHTAGAEPTSAGDGPNHHDQPDEQPGGCDSGEPLIETTAVARPRWLFPVRVPQVAAWEVVLLLVLATRGWAEPLVLLSALLAVLLTSIRFRGLTGVGWAAVAVEFRVRQARRPSAAPGSVLTAAVGDADIVDNIDRAGNRIGIVQVAGGCSALVRAAPFGSTSIATLLDALDSALARGDVPLHSAQLLVRGALGADGTPMQVHWLAVHFRSDEAPQAALARGGGIDGARKATAAATLLLARDLAEAGCAVSLLKASEVRHDLLVTLGIDLAKSAEATQVQETWRSWSIGTGRQSCHRVVATVPAETLCRTVAGAAFVCSSLTRRRDGHDELVIRVADRPELGWMTDTQRPTDAFTTHGQQDRYVRRSLPLALD